MAFLALKSHSLVAGDLWIHVYIYQVYCFSYLAIWLEKGFGCKAQLLIYFGNLEQFKTVSSYENLIKL